jgi:hypothetical protein
MCKKTTSSLAIFLVHIFGRIEIIRYLIAKDYIKL